MITTIYLFRHATYESPRHVLPVRLPGFHLSGEGKEAAQKLAEYFRNHPVAAVYASPLERTKETADIIAASLHLTVVTDERLLEIRSPTQGKPEEFGETMGGWNMYETEWYKKEGGESQEDIVARMDAFMKDKVAIHNGQKVIVVSHGDPIMLYRARLEGKKLHPDQLSSIPYIQMGHGVIMKFTDGVYTGKIGDFPRET